MKNRKVKVVRTKMETQNLIKEFKERTGAAEEDAVRCLKTWGFDLKKALIDYNGKEIYKFSRLINNIIIIIKDVSLFRIHTLYYKPNLLQI